MNEKMTIPEVAKYLGCSRQNIYNYINKGYLRTDRDERGVFIWRDQVVYFKKASENLHNIITAILSGGINHD
jgi:excisionase family DNA binding protein